MMNRLKQVSFVGLIAILVGMAIWGWFGGSITGNAPISSPPTITTPVVTESPRTIPLPSTPSQEPLDIEEPEPSSPPATGTASESTPEAPVQPTSEPMADIDSTPVFIEIYQGEEKLVGAEIAYIQQNEEGDLNPPKGKAGWYGPPQWSMTPGNLSTRPAILAGHVTYGGPDVFYRLADVEQGDLVVITYEDGITAEFVIDDAPSSAPKNDITELSESTYSWVWSNEEPSRKVSIFTCDPSRGRTLGGSSLNNWVVQATRIS